MCKNKLPSLATVSCHERQLVAGLFLSVPVGAGSLCLPRSDLPLKLVESSALEHEFQAMIGRC